VHFLGSLSEVGVAYQAADCLAHPTLEDTFAMVVLEAMAHGLPVVVSRERYCGIAGLLQAGRDALVLNNPLDANALASALQQMLHQPGLAADLQEAGLHFAKAHLWGALAHQQEGIYLRLVQAQTV
jgi:UDP-glucose:(heptosyl)LPS alpha-1,3-glucosyltransferase